ncbi:MAG TPA: ferredoxin:thioredoxin reductase [Nitrospiraceae bacterium]|nr:ferredoxin:thioredoxin reductase [Nitrospiraceae bacterium]
MDVEQLYHMLQKTQEPIGYFFNKDVELIRDLLGSLLANKERYGYMSCPCRLASGERDKDKDIICPCIYREPDVNEYGSCYCNLYVSKEWNDGIITRSYIPERRPPDNMLY